MRSKFLLYSALTVNTIFMPASALEIQSEDKIKSSVSKPEEKLKPIPDNTFKSLDELSEDVPVSLPKDI